MRKTKKAKIWFLERINEINKPLVRDIKRKKNTNYQYQALKRIAQISIGQQI